VLHLIAEVNEFGRLIWSENYPGSGFDEDDDSKFHEGDTKFHNPEPDRYSGFRFGPAEFPDVRYAPGTAAQITSARSTSPAWVRDSKPHGRVSMLTT